jgi:hypothetical protein
MSLLSTPAEIVLVKDTERERQTREQLLRLFAQYRLDKWRYTEKVQIEEGAIPHSHPILTLNTQLLADDEQFLGVYIHEQMHWFLLLEEKFEQGKQALETFRDMYPNLPIKPPEGCGREFSNYLHIAVNYLEYLGLSELLGAEDAHRTLERVTHYTKIYELVLRDSERIGEVMNRHGLIPADRPPQPKIFINVS